MSEGIKISVVIPVYNSDQSIPELVERLIASFNQLDGYSPEIILVNDGSTDKSWDAITIQKNKYLSDIKAINLSGNYGQHNALLCGLNFATGEFVITMDDDLQHPPEEIIKLLERQKETKASLVYGMYDEKHHSFVRNVGSVFVRKTSSYRKLNKGGGSSFRLIRKNLVEVLVEKHAQHFMYLDAVLNWYNADVQLVKVKHMPRKFGKTGYSLPKLFNIYINVLYYYSSRPLKVIIAVGLISSLISFLVGLRFIYRKIFFDVPLGYTSIIVAIMFSTSLILFCLGVIGNYLYKLYHLQQNKPPYSIKNVL